MKDLPHAIKRHPDATALPFGNLSAKCCEQPFYVVPDDRARHRVFKDRPKRLLMFSVHDHMISKSDIEFNI